MENIYFDSRRILAFTSLLIAFVTVAPAAADTISLAWDANKETTVIGYIVHVGTQSGSYTQHIDVGPTTLYAWSSAVAGQRYCFAVSAYTAGYVEGPKSNEVCGFSNAPPVLVNPGSRSSPLGQSTNLQLQGSDPEGQPVSYSATGLPPGLTLMASTGFISGTPTAAGTFTVTAKVSDGVLSSSQTFTWTISAGDGTPPTVTITNPTSATTYTTTTSPLTLSGTASDNVGVSQVTWVNNTGGSGTATGTTTWTVGGITLAAGTNIITITARDAAGNMATDAITVTYSGAATGGSSGSGTGTINLTWDPVADSTVVGYVLYAGVQSGTYTIRNDVGLKTTAAFTNAVIGQPYCFAVSAYKAGPIESAKSAEVCGATSGTTGGTTGGSTGGADTTPPSVSITSPTSAATYTTTSSTVTVSGTASDSGGVAQVTWVNNLGGTGVASGTTSWNTGAITLQSGVNVITVTARDVAGNVNSTALSVTYNPVSSPSGTGTGLRGDYYSGQAFNSLLTTRVDPTVNFDWASGTPGTNLPADNFSVRWTGDVMAPVTGTYTFTTASDDGVRLWVNNQLVIDNWTDHAVVSNNSAGVALQAGQRYAVKLEYYENGGLATIRLQWTPPGQALQVIPQSALFASSGSTSGGTTSGGTATDTTTGLVAAYSFNAGAGTTVADSSGRGNNGVANSTAAWSTGKFGNAMRFNGVDAIVTVPDSASLDLTTAMTLEAWVKPASIPVGWRTVLHKNVDPYFLMVSDPNGKPAGGGNFTNGTAAYGVGPSVLAVNTWTHLAATFDGSIVKLYVNGALVSSATQTAPLLTSSGTLQIGGSVQGEFFDGWIDEIRIYNRALSAADIQSTMNAPLP